MPKKAARLHIRRLSNGYKSSLTLPSGKSISDEEMQVDNLLRSVILDRLRSNLTMATGYSGDRQNVQLSQAESGADTSVSPAASLEEWGQLLFKTFLPPRVRKALRGLSSPLQIYAEADQDIPWELLHDGNQYLSLRLSLTRDPPQDCTSSTLRPKQRADLEALLIGVDPGGKLPHVTEEVEKLDQALRSLNIKTNVLLGERARLPEVLEELGIPHYGIVHFAGHVHYDSKDADRCGLCLYNGEILTRHQIRTCLEENRLIFVNGCYSARKAKEISNIWNMRGGTSLAEAFLEGGGWGFIGTQWPVDDEASLTFALEFYKHLVEGDSVGEALLAARKETWQKDPKGYTWSAFVYYGSPQQRIVSSPEGRALSSIRKWLRIIGISVISILAIMGILRAIYPPHVLSPINPTEAPTSAGVSAMPSVVTNSPAPALVPSNAPSPGPTSAPAPVSTSMPAPVTTSVPAPESTSVPALVPSNAPTPEPTSAPTLKPQTRLVTVRVIVPDREGAKCLRLFVRGDQNPIEPYTIAPDGKEWVAIFSIPYDATKRVSLRGSNDSSCPWNRFTPDMADGRWNPEDINREIEGNEVTLRLVPKEPEKAESPTPEKPTPDWD